MKSLIKIKLLIHINKNLSNEDLPKQKIAGKRLSYNP